MSEAQAKLQKTAQVAEDASQTIATALAVVGVGAAVAGAAAVKMAAKWEHTEIAFASMLKSGEKSQEFLAGLADFVARTPFEMPGVLASTRRLLAFGFQAEEIIPVMTSVGDAVAALGGGAFEIERVTRALGQMRAKGRLTSQEMSLQLTEAGIPAWEYLAEAIGTTVPEAMKKVEQRLIPATVGVQAVLDGMARNFGGSMDMMSKTTIGLWSTVLDHLRVVGTGIGAVLIDAFGIKPLLADMANAFGGLSREIMQAEDKAQAMRNILRRTFTPEIQGLIAAIAGAIAGLLVPAFIALTKKIWAATVALAPFMLKGAAVALTAYLIYRAFASAGWGIAGFSVFFIRMAAAVVGVLGVLIPSLRHVSQQMNAYADSVASASRAAKVFSHAGEYPEKIAKSGNKAAEAQEKLGEATEEAAKRAGGNILAFDQVHQLQEDMAKAAGAEAIQLPDVTAAAGIPMPEIAMPDVTAMTGPITAMAASWDKVTASLERARPVLEAVGYIIAGVVIVNVLKLAYKLLLLASVATVKAVAALGNFAAALLWSVAGIVDKVIALGVSIAKYVKLGVIATITAIKIAAKWLWLKAQVIAGVAAQVAQFVILGAKWAWLGMKALLAAGKMAAGWLIAIWPIALVVAAVVGLAALIIAYWDEIKLATQNIWGVVIDWLADRWDGISSTASRIWGGMKETVVGFAVDTVKDIEKRWRDFAIAVGRTWDSIASTASRIWEGMKTTVVTYATNLSNDAERMLGRLWDHIRGIPSQAVVWGANIIAGLWDGISGWSGRLNNNVRGFVGDNIVNPIKSFLRISSPSGLMIDFGRGVATGLAQGMENNTAAVRGASTTLTQNITDPLNNAVPGLANTGRSLVDSLISGIQGMKGGLQSTVRGLEQSLRITVPQPVIPHVTIPAAPAMPAAPAVPAAPQINIPAHGLTPHAQHVVTSPGFLGMSRAGQESLARSLGIPGFQRGGMVLGNQPTLALLHPPEAVVPLRRGGTGVDTIADAVGNAVLYAMRESLHAARAGQGGDSREIVLEVDGARLGRVILPALRNEGYRTGVVAT
ncbi:MAG TPA: tape measure protein [Dissulfurispiraceae bacterium]|nr:tape measure protein [Dissulfurispiraceae bacterium]